MADYIGQLGHVGTGVESAWGTGVAPVKFEPDLTDANLVPRLGIEHPDAITGAGAQRRRRIGVSYIEGTLNFDVSAGGMIPHFLWGTFGVCSTVHVTSNVASGTTYDHTFSFPATSADLITPPSVTIEENRGAYCRRYQGCRVDRLTLSIAQAEAAVLRATAVVRGKNMVSSGPASVSYNADESLGYGGWTVLVDSTAGTFAECTIEFARNLQVVLTSGQSGTPYGLLAGNLDISGSFRQPLGSDTRLADYQAGTTRALWFSWKGTTTNSAALYEIRVHLPLCDFTALEHPLAAGVLYETLNWRARIDASSGIGWAWIRNATSGY